MRCGHIRCGHAVRTYGADIRCGHTVRTYGADIYGADMRCGHTVRTYGADIRCGYTVRTYGADIRCGHIRCGHTVRTYGTHTVRTYGADITVRTYGADIRCGHTVRTYGADMHGADIRCGHTVRTYGADIRCGHTVRTYGADIRCGHTVRTYGADIRCGHTVRTYGADIRLLFNDKNPIKSLVLLKTHRTGSSTLANILYRYGDLNNLDFALPKESTYEYYWPVSFNPSFIDKQYMNTSRPVKMLVNARLHRTSMALWKGKGAFMITVLRDPVSHFESSFYSNHLDSLFGLQNSSDPLHQFLQSPKQILARHLHADGNEN
ncbi:hypothetical protein QZH41_001792 [Actinostola sp. cb2023]|nr:hypothetical protein QZH41_001792 [Actinostola sp. cb2023]